jgi:hypothetical protein
LHPDFYIVWFNEQHGEGQIIKCRDLTNEVKIMIDVLKKQPELFPMRPFTKPVIPESKVKTVTIMDDLKLLITFKLK